MDYALYGVNGPWVTLPMFVHRQGSDKNKWAVQPICPGCGLVVDHYNMKMAQGFAEASKEIFNDPEASKKIIRMGFDHRNGEGNDCVYSNKNDTFYNAFRKNEFADEIVQQNIKILRSPEVRELNARVLEVLYKELTLKSPIPKTDKERMWDLAQRKVCTMMVIAEQPWLFPFAMILLEGHRNRIIGVDKNTRQPKYEYLCFRHQGHQNFYFRGIDNKQRIAVVPQSIQLHFSNITGPIKKPKPFRPKNKATEKRENIIYEVSKKAAEEIAAGTYNSRQPVMTGRERELYRSLSRERGRYRSRELERYR